MRPADIDLSDSALDKGIDPSLGSEGRTLFEGVPMPAAVILLPR